jgi:lipopolysaccharide export system protein LptA
VRIVSTTTGWALVMWAAVAFSAAPQPPAGRALPSNATTDASPTTAFRNAPMTITSERLTIHDAEHRASFEGSVVARQGDLTLRADRVDIWTVDTPSAMSGMTYGGSNVSLIKAYGHVEVTQNDRVVQADQAVYTQATQQIELMGNLSGHEAGGYKVAGTHMVIYLQEHRSVIEQSHVVIPPAALSTSPGPQASPRAP